MLFIIPFSIPFLIYIFFYIPCKISAKTPSELPPTPQLDMDQPAFLVCFRDVRHNVYYLHQFSVSPFLSYTLLHSGVKCSVHTSRLISTNLVQLSLSKKKISSANQEPAPFVHFTEPALRIASFANDPSLRASLRT